PVAEALEPHTYMWNAVVDVAATAVWELTARDLAPRFRQLARTALATGSGLLGSNELTLARLLALTGGQAAAREQFARARTGLEADGRRPLRAIVDHDEALVLLGARPPDRLGAAPLLSAALDQFEALGMDAWAAHARALRDGVRLAAWGPTPGAAVDRLTERELEVLRLIAAGRTNGEIANALVISVRTAEHHVANVDAKIGARGRAEAVAYAVGRGIAASR